MISTLVEELAIIKDDKVISCKCLQAYFVQYHSLLIIPNEGIRISFAVPFN